MDRFEMMRYGLYRVDSDLSPAPALYLIAAGMFADDMEAVRGHLIRPDRFEVRELPDE